MRVPNRQEAGDLVLELPNDLATIQHAVDYVLSRCSGCVSDAKRLRLNLRVGLTEALANAMLYGNSHDPLKRVRVEIALGPEHVTARVTDEGSGFDPREVPDPTSANNLHKSGGRGLYLMRTLLDDVQYNDRGNSVTLVLRNCQGGLGGGAQA